eukprot:CAMPEP_0201528098 /NCGR_PEP_ID=MMETSP0161_2-20130828/37306_1 /ASSEMBLY_ACC=CAM_ASM_000251 /TAXON_ID=180227 /ORGANISM="Neoparamoeba aestuarina, Strain SoJaBio B1-5/56/2" /LENGTH=515 /DNA_ID=CAMNT_0047929239 /DNA_START=29 /DNA_END=1576 /DNA_ORIENTATION=-
MATNPAFSETTQNAAEQQQRILEHLDQEKRARSLAVPTKDALVKARLRELGEPICLFGENAGDRRQRLRMVMVQLGVTEGMPKIALEEQRVKVDASVDDKKQVYYTPGTKDLKDFRLWCLNYSIPKAKKRVAGQKALRDAEVDELEKMKEEEGTKRIRTGKDTDKVVNQRMKQVGELRKFVNLSSQVEDMRAARPVSSISFAPNQKLLATASWSGSVKVWESETFRQVKQFRGHTERATQVLFHPHSSCEIPSSLKTEVKMEVDDTEIPSSSSSSSSSVDLISCSVDKMIHLWSLSSPTPIATLTGHMDRINRIAIHPFGRHIASTSNDMTWRLWDLETKSMLLEQEGHSRASFGCAFHPDGSLLCSTGLDSFGRVWDLRSGKSIFLMKGHVSGVLTTDWAPDGFTLVTGGDDNAVRIWDLRRKRCVYTVPAHAKLVSQAKFWGGQRENFLVTCSYDKTVKIWGGGDWTMIKSLSGHDGQVSAVDVSGDGEMIASCGLDKTWKVWKKEEEEEFVM